MDESLFHLRHAFQDCPESASKCTVVFLRVQMCVCGTVLTMRCWWLLFSTHLSHANAARTRNKRVQQSMLPCKLMLLTHFTKTQTSNISSPLFGSTGAPRTVPRHQSIPASPDEDSIDEPVHLFASANLVQRRSSWHAPARISRASQTPPRGETN